VNQIVVNSGNPILKVLGYASFKDLLASASAIPRLPAIKISGSKDIVSSSPNWASRVTSYKMAVTADGSRVWRYQFLTKVFVDNVQFKFSTYVEGDYYTIRKLDSENVVQETIGDTIYARSSTQTTNLKKEFKATEKIEITCHAKTSAQTVFIEMEFYSYVGTYTEGSQEAQAEDAWSTMTVLTTGRTDLESFQANSIIYCLPGQTSPYNHNQAYTIADDTWATKTVVTTARFAGAAAAISTTGFFFGGYAAGMKNTNEGYSISGDSWSTKTVLTTALDYQTASMLNELIYMFGGINASYDNVANNSEYDPVANAWTTRTGLTVAGSGCASSPLDPYIWIVGGAGDTNRCNRYDPILNAMTTKTDMTTARGNLGAFTLNDKIYAVGGDSVAGVENEEYDPSTNTWAVKADMTTARSTLTGNGDAVDYGFAIGGNSSSKNENERYQ
jgi:hypothetical protein